MNSQEELFRFFKTFVDVERLKIVGVLAKHPATVQTLVSETNMTAPSILRHIEQLRNTGLILSSRSHEGQEVVELATQMLEEMAKRQFALARELEHPEPDQRNIPADFTEEERKVLLNYSLPNGEIKQIPLQQKKQQILIRYARHNVLRALNPDQRYTEKEINTIIKQLHPDAPFFRRNFVDTGYLDRYDNGCAYWMTEKAIALVAEAAHAR